MYRIGGVELAHLRGNLEVYHPVAEDGGRKCQAHAEFFELDASLC